MTPDPAVTVAVTFIYIAACSLGALALMALLARTGNLKRFLDWLRF